MLPELMLNWPVALTSFVVVLDLVLRVPFMLWPVCFCNMVLLLVGVRYLLTHLMLLTASTVLHCFGMFAYYGLVVLNLFLIPTVVGQHW